VVCEGGAGPVSAVDPRPRMVHWQCLARGPGLADTALNRGGRLARRALPVDSPRVAPGYAANRGQRILLHGEATGGNPLLAWCQ
jgi:hypothetical protein